MDLNGFINLDKICILLADSSPQGMDILSQIFTGFGARNITRCASIALASDFIRSNDVDLIVVNDTVGTESGYDFVHWLRRQEGNQMLELSAGDALREKIGNPGWWEPLEDNSVFIATDAPVNPGVLPSASL